MGELPRIDQRVAEARDAGLNPLAAALQAPGIRLLPGTYVAGQLAQGTKGVGELADNPLLTALDVLPVASKVAGATKVGSTALREGAELGAKANPLRALASRKLLPAGELSLEGSRLGLNKLGEATAAGARTRFGQWMTDAFSQQARGAASVVSMHDQEFAELLKGKTPVEGIDKVARESYSMMVEARAGDLGLSPEDIVNVTKTLETDRNLIPTLPDAQQDLARRAVEIQQQYEDFLVGDNAVLRMGGEVYDSTSGKKLVKAVDRMGKLSTKAAENITPRLDQLIANGMDDLFRADSIPQAGVNRITQVRDTIGQALDGTSTWRDASKQFDVLMSRRTNLGSPGQVGKAGGAVADVRLDSLSKIQRELKSLASAQKKAEKLSTLRAPPRWHSNIQRKASETAEQFLVQKGVDPVEATRVVLERDFSAYPDLFNRKAINDLVRDIEPTWQEMKAAGVDPVFVHRVPTNREQLLRLPRVSEFVGELSQTKARTLTGDITPYRQDITIALSHQGAEILARRLSESYVSSLMATWGKPEADLVANYMPEARALAVKDPTLDPMAHVKDLMLRDYQPFKPTQFGGRSARSVSMQSEVTWMPRSLIRNLDRIHNPSPSALLSTIAPVTGAFRTSVLALSPRWHLYNIIGNTIRLMAEEGPVALFNWGEARRLVREAKEGSIELQSEARYSLNVARQELAADRSLTRGGKFADAWKKVEHTKIAQAGSTIVQKSYDINSFFDDTTKIMGYLQGQKRARRKGVGETAASVEALTSMRKVGQMCNEMTPIERGVIRQVFPFYSFTGNIMRYVMGYPFDHPIRASIMASFARAELEDQGSGLPADWLDSMGIGPVDDNGNQARLSLKGMNPFGDVGDLFTLKGFIAGINPVGNTVLQQLGADTGMGGPFGAQSYSAETGRLTDPKPPITSAISNVIPQTATLARVLGLDKEFAATRRNNPAASSRLLLSGLGIPASVRSMNVPQARMKSELNRIEAQRQALKSALASGDYSEAERYPGLRELVSQVKILRDQGALTPYNPTSGAPGGITGLKDALVPGRPWPT